MKKASKRRYSERKQELIKKRVVNWSFREEKFCSGIAEELRSGELGKDLSNDELVEMIALLLMSCKNSIVRVNDKRKKTYYQKPRQFTDKYVMLSEIIHKKRFLKDWVQQFKKYKEHDMNLEHRPTLGRIDSDKGYLLNNIEAQAYGENTAQMMIERRSQPCVALVASRSGETGIVIESPSAANCIARINELMGLGLSRSSFKGNLSEGISRLDGNDSISIISRDRLLAEPVVIDMGVTMHNVVDDVSVRLAVLPEISEYGCQKVRLQLDDLGIVYADFVEEDTATRNQ
ncbi:hypothetical protein [Paenibacillus sp. ISL-20]|uniref:hypothetical protein n=1 Tax=Paenibacillus sp. ISL-20 TaxID=2819163 RepID=UPI001BE920CF|nr:hypothetical protein [Paenibacillus sp. ISL-20]MBT2764295.1 hypothetical protein [Paenibacillus sp. ISL-20]